MTYFAMKLQSAGARQVANETLNDKFGSPEKAKAQVSDRDTRYYEQVFLKGGK